jgi:hypothetical protein
MNNEMQKILRLDYMLSYNDIDYMLSYNYIDYMLSYNYIDVGYHTII